jgi:regulatory protein
MKAPVGRQPKTQKSRPAAEPDRVFLETAALRYLNRFDVPVEKLRQKLEERVMRTFELKRDDPQMQAVRQGIDEVLERLVSTGVLNDARYARIRAESLRARGASRRAVEAKLRLTGVSSDEVQDAITNVDSVLAEPELAAACRLVKRRRLGWCRPVELRQERQARDLAVLARAGFSYHVAAKALAMAAGSSDIECDDGDITRD